MAIAKKKAPVIRTPAARVVPRAAKRTGVEGGDGHKTAMLHLRLDDRLKADATSVLDEIGISLSEALRVFLTRVVSEKAIPFRLEVPNAATRAAMEEARRSAALPTFETADELFDELEKGPRG